MEKNNPNPSAIPDTGEANIIELPSGRKAEVKPFKGRHLRQAMQIAGGDQSQVIFALIAQLTTIDAKGVVMEDLDDMDGRDLLTLMGHFGENF